MLETLTTWVYTIPAWLGFVIIVAVSAALACGGHVLVRRSFPRTDFIEHNEVAGFIFAVVGVFFAQQAMIGKRGPQLGAQERLDVAVERRHGIVLLFALEFEHDHAPEGSQRALACRAGKLDRGLFEPFVVRAHP